MTGNFFIVSFPFAFLFTTLSLDLSRTKEACIIVVASSSVFAATARTHDSEISMGKRDPDDGRDSFASAGAHDISRDLSTWKKKEREREREMIVIVLSKYIMPRD